MSNVYAQQKRASGLLLLRERGPLGAYAYTSVRCVGDEASNTDTSGLLLRKGSEVDTLYPAFDLVLNLGVCISFAQIGPMQYEIRTRLVDMTDVVERRRFINRGKWKVVFGVGESSM